MARIFLIHIPDMLRNFYGERAVGVGPPDAGLGRMPPHAVNPDAATRLARLRKP